MAGPQVLKNAQTSESARTRANWYHGKKKSTVEPKKRLYYRSIVYPTSAPINIPRMHELSTSISAS